VQAVVKLALEAPRKLWAINFARTEQKEISVNFHSFGLKKYLDLNAFGRWPGCERKQGMLIARNLMPYLFQMGLHQ
jgi:hypothetical protein